MTIPDKSSMIKFSEISVAKHAARRVCWPAT